MAGLKGIVVPDLSRTIAEKLTPVSGNGLSRVHLAPKSNPKVKASLVANLICNRGQSMVVAEYFFSAEANFLLHK